MKVTRIEVFGFKSFMDRLILPLEAGITGVVGPNGCGKSNVVDALRWVLGETKASSLRGDVLEDIIFNGTENLRPLGLAEVSITLRSAGPDFFADLVDPNMEQDSQVGELVSQLEDASSKVIEFSKIPEQHENEVLNSDAEASQEHHSEAGHEHNTERPRLKVIKGHLGEAKKQQNLSYLSRFSWLRNCNEVQVTRRLYRSGESEFFINRVPCRLKDMKDLFRALGLGARAYTIVAQGEVSRIVSAKPEERRTIIEEAAGVLGFRDKIQTAKRRLEDTAVNISRLDDLITEVSRQVNILKKQAQRAKERQALKENIMSLDRMLFADEILGIQSAKSELERSYQRVKELEAVAETQLSSVQTMEHEARAALMSVDVETDAVRSKIDAIREELNNRAQQRSHGELKINEIKAYAVAATTERERLDSTFNTLSKRKEECQIEIERLTSEVENLAVRLQEHERFVNSNRLTDIAKEIEALKEQIRENDKHLRSHRDEFSLKKGALEQVNKTIEESSPLVRFELPEDLSANTKMLAEMLEINPKYSKALQAVLADKVEYLVSEDPFQVAKLFINKKSQSAPEEQANMGVGVLRSKEFVPNINRNTIVNNESMTPLLDFVSVSSEKPFVVTDLLRNVYLANDVNSAINYFENNQNDSSTVLVTIEGDLITRDLFSSFKHKSNVIDLKNKAQELNSSCQQIESEIGRYSELNSQLNLKVGLHEAEQSKTLDEIQARQKELREVSNLHAGELGRLESEKRVLAQVNDDINHTENQKNSLLAKLDNYKAEEMKLLEELQGLVTEEDVKIKEELEILKKEHHRLDVIRKDGHTKLSDAASRLDESRSALDSARSEVSEVSLALQKTALEESNLQSKIINSYGPDFLENLSSDYLNNFIRPDAVKKSDASEEVTRLKARLLREGEVDFSSIERFEEENSRLQSLNQQKTDLKEAAATLERTIELLTETSKTRFLSTYDEIRRNFTQLVPKLFGGGKADLELLDPVNPLESGVEISVRPPGKKPRSIELLSGGEKALSATALIFSMFLVRPSPLCVLDEVDAPLDEANLVRLVSLIKEMSKKTQFIMITHNKQSMVASDNLIGVTMQEPGASKVISVSLQEAFSQVA